MKTMVQIILLVFGLLLLTAALLAVRAARIRRRNLRRKQHQRTVQARAVPEPTNSCQISKQTKQNWDLWGCYTPALVPEVRSPKVESVSLTGQEAAAQGFSFQKKSKSVRITNYHGSAVQLVLPSAIDGMPVNEIREQAFSHNSTLRRVEIPASIRKIGAYAFAGTQIEYCAIAAQVQALPEGMFAGCTWLCRVLLPEHLVRIGERAFVVCKALHEITFPQSCWDFGDDAFAGSGLSGFSVTPQGCVNNGAAFRQTPLHRNYRFVLRSVNEHQLDILLCGAHTDETLYFPDTAVRLGKGSLTFCSARVFDLTACTEAEISPDAFRQDLLGGRHLLEEKSARIILPRVCSPTCFPWGVTAENADGTTFVQTALQGKWETDKTVSLQTNASILPPHGIRGNMTAMTITHESGGLLKAAHHAFAAPQLISLKAPLSGESESLLSPICGRLQRVQFPENGEMITKYIPDKALIGTLHTQLLEAFRGDGTHFFDRRVYDRIFERGTYRWTDGSCRPLTQKQRLLLCFDVLRSTQRAHEGEPCLYASYLCSHLRYARKLCKKPSDTHPEYLRWLAEQNPTEWFLMVKRVKDVQHEA